MKSSLVMYLLLLVSVWTGCHLGPINSPYEEPTTSQTDMSPDPGGPQAMMTDMQSDAGLEYNDCKKENNKGRGFCKANWIKCQTPDYCENNIFRDYIKIKSKTPSSHACECKVDWEATMPSISGKLRMAYGYKIPIDTVVVRVLYNKTGSWDTLQGINKNSYANIRKFPDDPNSINQAGFSFQVIFNNTCADCIEKPELRIYLLKITNAMNDDQVIYEAPERDWD